MFMSEKTLQNCLLILVIISGCTLAVAVSIDPGNSSKRCKPGSVEALFVPCERISLR